MGGGCHTQDLGCRDSRGGTGNTLAPGATLTPSGMQVVGVADTGMDMDNCFYWDHNSGLPSPLTSTLTSTLTTPLTLSLWNRPEPV
jgi:hypothetical protein